MTGSSSLGRRIAATVLVALVALSAILLGFAELRASWLRDRLERAELGRTLELLETIRALDAALLARVTAELARAPEVDAALAGGEGTADAVEALFEDVQQSVEFDLGLALLDARGQPVASRGAVPAAGGLPAAGARTGGGGSGIRLGTMADGRLGHVVASEVRRGDQTAGRVVGVIDLGDRARAFFASADALAFLPLEGEPVMSAGEAALAAPFAEACCSDEARVLTAGAGGRRLTASAVPVADTEGALLGSFLSIRDITEESARQWLLLVLSLCGVLIVILLSVGVLMRALRVALRPLGAIVKLLRGLSQGDTRLALRPVAAAREIEQLVDTVAAFRQAQKARAELMALGEQLAAARRIQQSLLPDRFDISERLAIGGEMVPAGEVGGDFLDVFEVGDGRVAVLIADVSGEGIAPALFAARASTVLRSNARVLDDPVAIVSATNDELCTRNPEGLFITVFFAVVDPETGRVAAVNGGHCPPFVARADGSVGVIEGAGDLVLGAFEGFPYTARELVLEPGDTLLVYSDGFDEAQNGEGELLGLDRARAITASCAALGVGPMVEAIIARIRGFAAGAQQADDITLLAIRRATPG